MKLGKAASVADVIYTRTVQEDKSCTNIISSKKQHHWKNQHCRQEPRSIVDLYELIFFALGSFCSSYEIKLFQFNAA